MTDVAALIAEAMTEARGKYSLTSRMHPADWHLQISLPESPFFEWVFDGTRAACEAHLERLVADHVVAVLREKGYVIINTEPWFTRSRAST